MCFRGCYFEQVGGDNAGECRVHGLECPIENEEYIDDSAMDDQVEYMERKINKN